MLSVEVGQTAIRELHAKQTAKDDLALPVYCDPTRVPRDLRSAEELLRGGYKALGPVVAWLEIGPGEVGSLNDTPSMAGGSSSPITERVALHSTSEARRLKGYTWSWPQRSTPRGSVQRPADRGGSSGSGPTASASGRRRSGPVGHTPLVTRSRRRPTLRVDPDRWINELFKEGFVVIDTETTGLSARDEIIEIAVVGADGSVLFESLVRPRSGRVPAASTRIHGLTFSDVARAPTWPEVVDRLHSVVAGHRVFAWNAGFDERLSVQSSRAWALPHPLPGFECAMRAYAACRGIGSGSMRLERAASVEGVLRSGQAHRSADDARLTLAVLNCLRRSPAAA